MGDIWPTVLPVAVVYAILCGLLNWGINLLNVAWIDRHRLQPTSLPGPIAEWAIAQNVRIYRAGPHHPFTPLLVIAGVLLTLGAAFSATWGTTLTPPQTVLVTFGFFALGGVIMTAGDALRYLQHG